MKDLGNFVEPPRLITLASEGGPHDDESYLSGYAMGALDALLGYAAWTSDNVGIRWLYDKALDFIVISEVNLEQADLITMRHGYTSTFDPYEGHPGFHRMRVRRGTEVAPGESEWRWMHEWQDAPQVGE